MSWLSRQDGALSSAMGVGVSSRLGGRSGVDILISEPEVPKDIPAGICPDSWLWEPRVEGQGLGCCC